MDGFRVFVRPTLVFLHIIKDLDVSGMLIDKLSNWARDSNNRWVCRVTFVMVMHQKMDELDHVTDETLPGHGAHGLRAGYPRRAGDCKRAKCRYHH